MRVAFPLSNHVPAIYHLDVFPFSWDSVVAGLPGLLKTHCDERIPTLRHTTIPYHLTIPSSFYYLPSSPQQRNARETIYQHDRKIGTSCMGGGYFSFVRRTRSMKSLLGGSGASRGKAILWSCPAASECRGRSWTSMAVVCRTILLPIGPGAASLMPPPTRWGGGSFGRDSSPNHSSPSSLRNLTNIIPAELSPPLPLSLSLPPHSSEYSESLDRRRPPRRRRPPQASPRGTTPPTTSPGRSTRARRSTTHPRSAVPSSPVRCASS